MKDALIQLLANNDPYMNEQEYEGLYKYVHNLDEATVTRMTKKIMLERKKYEAVELYKQGVPVIEIAKKLNLTREGVYLYLRKLPKFKGLSKKLRENKSSQWKHKIKQAILHGDLFSVKDFTFSKAAKHFGTTIQAIKDIVKGTRYDISHSVKAKRNQEIKDLYDSGLTQTELGRVFNLSQARIHYILQKFKNDKVS